MIVEPAVAWQPKRNVVEMGPLREGVTKKKRENLGQCPNRGIENRGGGSLFFKNA